MAISYEEPSTTRRIAINYPRIGIV
jgi:hypothetical protein